MSEIRPRRLGRFKVHRRFFDGLSETDGANLFIGMIVLDVQRDFMTGDAEYLAVHPEFRHVPSNEIVPAYRAIFTEGSSVPSWIEITQPKRST